MEVYKLSDLCLIYIFLMRRGCGWGWHGSFNGNLQISLWMNINRFERRIVYPPAPKGYWLEWTLIYIYRFRGELYLFFLVLHWRSKARVSLTFLFFRGEVVWCVCLCFVNSWPGVFYFWRYLMLCIYKKSINNAQSRFICGAKLVLSRNSSYICLKFKGFG